MKFEYEKPELEELVLLLEGSAFCGDTTEVGKDDSSDPSDGDGWD